MPEGDAARDLASAVQGSPTPAAPTGADSAGQTVSRAEFDALNKKLDSILQGVEKVGGLEERLKQSQRDTIDDRVRKAVPPEIAALGALAPILKPHMKDGVDLQQLQRNALSDYLLAGGSLPGTAAGSPQAPATPSGQTVQDPVEAEVGRILKDNGLTGREPELREFIEQNADKPLLVKLNGLSELAQTIRTRTAGDAGSIIAGTSGKRASPDMVKQYVNTMLANKGKGFAVANKIKQQFRAQGVNVDAIDLLRPETWK